jgi:hypothetical protein
MKDDLFEMVSSVKVGNTVEKLNNFENNIDYETLINASLDDISDKDKNYLSNFGIKKGFIDNIDFDKTAPMIVLNQKGIDYCKTNGLFSYRVETIDVNAGIDIMRTGKIGSFQSGKTFRKAIKPTIMISNYFGSESNFEPEIISDDAIVGSRDQTAMLDDDGKPSMIDTHDYIMSNYKI